MSRRDRLGLGAVAVVVALAPLALTSQYHLSVGVFIGLHAIVTVGLCVLAGYAGQISLGQAAFYGIGAYASGVLTTRLGLDPWLAMGAAMALAALVAYAFGIPILKLHGHYLAMATLAFGIIVYLVFVELKDLTGGPSGLAGIPRLAVGGFQDRFIFSELAFQQFTQIGALRHIVLSNQNWHGFFSPIALTYAYHHTAPRRPIDSD